MKLYYYRGNRRNKEPILMRITIDVLQESIL